MVPTYQTILARDLEADTKHAPCCGLKKAVEIVLGTGFPGSDIQQIHFPGQIVRAQNSLDIRAEYNKTAALLITEKKFGSRGLPDADVLMNYSDVHFGGASRENEHFGLEELLVHSSRQLMAIVEHGVIPPQREGSIDAGEGSSHANVLSFVQFELDIDITKEVCGTKKRCLGTLWQESASKVYSFFEKRYGPMEAPRKLAQALKEQGVIKKLAFPANKVVVSQVAPSLTKRRDAIQRVQMQLSDYKQYLAYQQTLATSKQMFEVHAIEESIAHENFVVKDEVSDYFFAVDAGMEALMAYKSQEGKIGFQVYYPAGWFGTASRAYPGTLAALVQIALGSFRGINVVFHNFTQKEGKEKRTSELSSAVGFFETEILPLIAAKATKGRLLEKITEITLREKWPIVS